jgi:hypothetical protein
MNAGMIENNCQSGEKWWRLAAVVAGIIIGQFILCGPCLIGKRILLPLDALAMPHSYLPDTPQTQNSYPCSAVFQDLVLQFEPNRLFAIREFRGGHFPMWTPYEYGGAPFIAPKYSPFFLLSCLTESPIMIAWAQLLAALVAGTGAYAFFRRALRVSFWPATLAAWCYPLTGFLVLWQGFPTCAPVYWLPWLLLAVDRTVRGNRAAPLALALVSGLVLVSGHIDVAGQVLLVSGLYALWCWWDVYRPHLFRSLVGKTALTLALGWGLGFLLAAPHLLPLVEYAKTGSRTERRASGFEARQPIGLLALPQVVLPDMYGSIRNIPLFLLKDASNLLESPAATYTGVVATVLVAPWAWFSRRHRSMNVFWLLLAAFGLSWTLDVPGIVDLLRLPGLNLMSHNRLVFATSFAILAMTAIGLEALLHGLVRWRRQLWLQLALLVGLLGWCLYRTVVLPKPLADRLIRLEERARAGEDVGLIKGLEHDVQREDRSFSFRYKVSAAWCAAGLILWLALRFRLVEQRILTLAIGVSLFGDLLCFGYGRNAQCDHALYFPEIPALRDLAEAPSGRVIGFQALRANLAQVVGLKDVRGYDSIDPGRWCALLLLTADERSRTPEYGITQLLCPKVNIKGKNALRLSPVLDMLGVRYVIYRGKPPQGITPSFQSTDYWVMENRSAMPRAYVPQRVEMVPDGNEILYRLGLPDFDPRQVAYVEQPVNLPSDCRGTVRITDEIPTRIVVAAQMETPGLMVLADSWNTGWRAYLNGGPVPILRTNYAIRGIVLPAGSATIEFRYHPASATCGFYLAGVAAVILLGWLGIVLWSGSGTATSDNNNQTASPS